MKSFTNSLLIKSESEEKMHRLEAKLAACVSETTGIEPLLNNAIRNISQLDVLCPNGSITQKRKIIGSMFPENWHSTDFNIEPIALIRRLVLCA